MGAEIKPLPARQCAGCAYRGTYAQQAPDIQAAHLDWVNDGDFAGHPHQCHERPGFGCLGCARWTDEVLQKVPN